MPSPQNADISRRDFIEAGVMAAIGVLLPGPLMALKASATFEDSRTRMNL
jgi:hypothetical protein